MSSISALSVWIAVPPLSRKSQQVMSHRAVTAPAEQGSCQEMPCHVQFLVTCNSCFR
jgi:hypothetical protein